MATNAKVIDPHLDWSEQVKSIRLEVDQDSGLIALAGMIMRNTVILVDQIDHDIAEGHSRF